MTQKILEKTLRKNGVVPIDCLNKKFDPNLAEALVQVDDESKEPGTVVFIAQPGYITVK
jgi:molecular chaperone GrpE